MRVSLGVDQKVEWRVRGYTVVNLDGYVPAKFGGFYYHEREREVIVQ